MEKAKKKKLKSSSYNNLVKKKIPQLTTFCFGAALPSTHQFIQKKNRLAVYSYLFKDGCLVAKKDFFKAKHDEIDDVPNLEVLMLMKSMKSRGLVRETFNW